MDLVERSHCAAAASATENAQTEAKLVGFEKKSLKNRRWTGSGCLKEQSRSRVLSPAVAGCIGKQQSGTFLRSVGLPPTPYPAGNIGIARIGNVEEMVGVR